MFYYVFVNCAMTDRQRVSPIINMFYLNIMPAALRNSNFCFGAKPFNNVL